MSKFEVVFVDDASTDHTPDLEHYDLPFKFRYIRNSRNLGRARSRNIGIKNARGKILVFLDAEAIVEPNCISLHYTNHQKYKKAVVTGGNFYKIYSYLLPNFNDSQQKNIQSFMKRNDKFKKRIREKLQKQISSRDLPNVIKSLSKPVKLIHRKDIKKFYSLRKLSEPRIYELDLIRKLGNEIKDYHVSWLYCIGLNHSVKKSLIEEVGVYDEHFQGWGSEDYEIGYRLTKAGAIYVADSNIHVYHQEHPIEPSLKYEEARNMVYFQEKHPVMDVCIKSLQYINQNDARSLEDTVREYYSLSNKCPGRFDLFNDSMLRMLQEMPKIVSKNNGPITNLLEKIGISSDSERISQILSERDVIASYGKYDNLVKVFDKLIKL